MNVKKNPVYYVNVVAFLLLTGYAILLSINAFDFKNIDMNGGLCAVIVTMILCTLMYVYHMLKVANRLEANPILQHTIEIISTLVLITGAFVIRVYSMGDFSLDINKEILVAACMLLSYITARMLNQYGFPTLLMLLPWPYMISTWNYSEADIKNFLIMLAIMCVVSVIMYVTRRIRGAKTVVSVIFVLAVSAFLYYGMYQKGIASVYVTDYMDYINNFKAMFVITEANRFFYIGFLIAALISGMRIAIGRGTGSNLILFTINALYVFTIIYNTGDSLTYMLFPLIAIAVSGAFGLRPAYEDEEEVLLDNLGEVDPKYLNRQDTVVDDSELDEILGSIDKEPYKTGRGILTQVNEDNNDDEIPIELQMYDAGTSGLQTPATEPVKTPPIATPVAEPVKVAPVAPAPVMEPAPTPVPTAPVVTPAPEPVKAAPVATPVAEPVKAAPVATSVAEPVKTAPVATPTPEPVMTVPVAAPAPTPAPEPVMTAPVVTPTPVPTAPVAAPVVTPTPEPVKVAPVATPTPAPTAPVATPTSEPVMTAPAATPTPEPVMTAPVATPTPEPVKTAPVATPTPEPVIEEPKESFVIEEPVIEEPKENFIIEEPVIEEPKESFVIEEPVIEEPKESFVIEEPVIEEPKASFVIEEPVIEEPKESFVIEEPVIEEPKESFVIEEPVIEKPKESFVIEEPVIEEPKESFVIEEPVIEEPKESFVIEEPVINEPQPVAPVVEEPTIQTLTEDATFEMPVFETPVFETPVVETQETEKTVIEEPEVEEMVAEASVAETPIMEESKEPSVEAYETISSADMPEISMPEFEMPQATENVVSYNQDTEAPSYSYENNNYSFIHAQPAFETMSSLMDEKDSAEIAAEDEKSGATADNTVENVTEANSDVVTENIEVFEEDSLEEEPVSTSFENLFEYVDDSQENDKSTFAALEFETPAFEAPEFDLKQLFGEDEVQSAPEEKITETANVNVSSVETVLPENVDFGMDVGEDLSFSGAQSLFDFYDTDSAPLFTDSVSSAYEEPVAVEPIIEEPVAEEPAAAEPTVVEPEYSYEEPAVVEPIIEEPVAVEPAATEPVAVEPIIEEPIAEEPATVEPIETPTADNAFVEEYNYDEPVAEKQEETVTVNQFANDDDFFDWSSVDESAYFDDEKKEADASEEIVVNKSSSANEFEEYVWTDDLVKEIAATEISEQNTEEYNYDEPSAEPVVEEAVAEPIAGRTVIEAAATQTVAEPVAQAVVEQTVVEPIAAQAAIEPIAAQTAVETDVVKIEAEEPVIPEPEEQAYDFGDTTAEFAVYQSTGVAATAEEPVGEEEQPQYSVFQSSGTFKAEEPVEEEQPQYNVFQSSGTFKVEEAEEEVQPQYNVFQSSGVKIEEDIVEDVLPSFKRYGEEAVEEVKEEVENKSKNPYEDFDLDLPDFEPVDFTKKF